MREYFITLLPVLWALVSVGIALALYKTSEGFFEQKDKGKGKSRQIRLTGSFVIAAIAFLGMAQMTPDHLLKLESASSTYVSKADLLVLADRVAALEDQLVEVEGCAAVKVAGQCERELSSVKRAFNSVKSVTKKIVNP